MLGNMTGWHVVILLALVLLLFGAAKLPALARSVGQSARIFKGEITAMKTPDAAPAAAATADAAAPEAVAATAVAQSPATRTAPDLTAR